MERSYSVKRLIVLVGMGGEGDTERERSAWWLWLEHGEGCWCHFLWQGTLGAKWLLSKANDRKPVSLVFSLNQHMALTSSYSVILSHAQSLDLPIVDLWQCPNTFLIATISEVGGWLCPWHLLGKDLGYSWGPYNAKGRHLKQRITWCKMSKGLMLRNVF